MNTLKQKLNEGKFVRVIEAHDGLTAKMVDQAHSLKTNKQFDALWSSSLCDSLINGRPDMEVLSMDRRIAIINELRENSKKPIIVDMDSGGRLEQLFYKLKQLNEINIEAIVLEDKIGTKRNSLFGEKNPQQQDTIEHFSKKITFIQENKNSDLMLFARIESLTLGAGKYDALKRAKAYINAGADGILVHNANDSVEDLYYVIKKIKDYKDVPIIVVPTAFSFVTEKELEQAGVSIVIYANQLIRSTIEPIAATLNSILDHGRAFEANKNLISIKEVLNFIDEPPI